MRLLHACDLLTPRVCLSPSARPFDHGEVIRPMIVGRGGVLFMPQRPYIVEGGSLRDQLLYPDSPGRQACTDARVQTDAACGATAVSRAHTVPSVCVQLLEILSTLDLAFLSARKGGLDAMEDWANMLSGGEQQRLGFARLFYHRYVCRRRCERAGPLMHES